MQCVVVLQALVELSEQSAQELAEGSTAIGRVAELEARVAELEMWDRQLEANKVKAEDGGIPWPSGGLC